MNKATLETYEALYKLRDSKKIGEDEFRILRLRMLFSDRFFIGLLVIALGAITVPAISFLFKDNIRKVDISGVVMEFNSSDPIFSDLENADELGAIMKLIGMEESEMILRTSTSRGEPLVDEVELTKWNDDATVDLGEAFQRYSRLYRLGLVESKNDDDSYYSDSDPAEILTMASDHATSHSTKWVTNDSVMMTADRAYLRTTFEFSGSELNDGEDLTDEEQSEFFEEIEEAFRIRFRLNDTGKLIRFFLVHRSIHGTIVTVPEN